MVPGTEWIKWTLIKRHPITPHRNMPHNFSFDMKIWQLATSLTPTTGGPAHKRAGLAIVQKGPHRLADRHARRFLVRVHQLRGNNHLRVFGYHSCAFHLLRSNSIHLDARVSAAREWLVHRGLSKIRNTRESLNLYISNYLQRSPAFAPLFRFFRDPDAPTQFAGYYSVANSWFFGATRLTNAPECVTTFLDPPLSLAPTSMLFSLPLYDRRFGPSLPRGLGIGRNMHTDRSTKGLILVFRRMLKTVTVLFSFLI